MDNNYPKTREFCKWFKQQQGGGKKEITVVIRGNAGVAKFNEVQRIERMLDEGPDFLLADLEEIFAHFNASEQNNSAAREVPSGTLPFADTYEK